MAASRLITVALPCLVAFTLLASVVAHGHGPYGFEDPAFRWLGSPSTTSAWARLAEILAVPAIAVVFVVCIALGAVRRALLRVVVYAALAATALLVSEHVAKPLVQRSYYGEPTFPSGNVTAVSATALAMWLALYPLLGNRARVIVFVIGIAWTLLMALAVVGALWHTPLDDLGSVLLSVGIVTGGGAVFEHAATRRESSRGPGRQMVGDRG